MAAPAAREAAAASEADDRPWEEDRQWEDGPQWEADPRWAAALVTEDLEATEHLPLPAEEAAVWAACFL